MPPRVKSLWNKTLDLLTGSVATVIFRLMITLALFSYHFLSARVKDFIDAPGKINLLAKDLESFQTEFRKLRTSFIELQTNQLEVNKDLVTKVDMRQELSNWQNEKGTLQRLVEGHEQKLTAYGAQISEVRGFVEQILKTVQK